MNAGFKLNELSYRRVQTSLRNIGTIVPDNARKTMRRAAERIVRKAKLYVPEDSSALMNSIRLEASYGLRGRLQIDVVAGGQDVINVKGRLINLDQYAAIIHEQYDEMEPGERTKQKMMDYPGKVGSRFLSRAAEEEQQGLMRDLVVAITQTIKTEGFK